MDDILWRWGRWARWEAGKDLGYRRVNVLYRLMRQGPSGASHAGVWTPRCPEDVSQTEKLVVNLGLSDRRMLVAHYVISGTSADKAARLGMSRATYWRRLEAAKVRISRLLGLNM